MTGADLLASDVWATIEGREGESGGELGRREGACQFLLAHTAGIAVWGTGRNKRDREREGGGAPGPRRPDV